MSRNRADGRGRFSEPRRRHKDPGRAHVPLEMENLRIDRALKPAFEKIGIPEARPFRPDPFQQEALARMTDYDVLVSAPTGAGKTWIAAQAIHDYLSRGLRVWYASPLKALSNSIYHEFCQEFGPTQCGILTGDRKENPDAPIVVGTTEILRNQLYDAMHEGTSISTDLVILDEAHYLSDPERGVVWEEVLIYLPSRVRLLLLSATISNPQEVCAWLHEIRGVNNWVVRDEERPVPLVTLFLLDDGLVVPLGSRRGLNPKVRVFMASRPKHRGRSERMDFGSLLKGLRSLDLLPAIFFLKSRADCDRAILKCSAREEGPKAKTKLKRTVADFLKAYPHLLGHRQMKPLLDSLVGAHHGGQLPYWKVLIETLMNKGWLEAIFSTSTVAAGVNFPARTVVLLQSDRFDGHDFADLTATELHQMMGRAGRRGKDQIGFALILPGVHQDPGLIHSLSDSPPDPIRSQIHVNFSMTLNLLLSHSPEEVHDLFQRSLASFQAKNAASSCQQRWEGTSAQLQKLLEGGFCDTTDPYEVAELLGDGVRVHPEKKKRSKEDLPALCQGCDHVKECHKGKKARLGRLLEELLRLAPGLKGTGTGLWLSFKRHVRFLRETGFVDSRDRLTADGRWASKLRLDQPLLIAEAIRKKALDGLFPELLSGGLAPFVWDRAGEVELRRDGRHDLQPVETVFESLLAKIQGIRKQKTKRGFDTPPLLYWPSAALFLWAKGVEWEELLRLVPVDEGDMASLITRTADHLRQVASLRETHALVSRTAERAVGLIMREPVYIE